MIRTTNRNKQLKGVFLLKSFTMKAASCLKISLGCVRDNIMRSDFNRKIQFRKV